MNTENLNNIERIIGDKDKKNVEIRKNENFGKANSYHKFEMNNDCFKTYDFDDKTNQMFDKLIDENLNEDFDVKYFVYNKEFNYNEGCIIGSLKDGKIFDDYIFSMMELDENT